MEANFSRPIFVTKPILPPLSSVVAGIERIYQSGIVTNMGPLHEELQLRLEALLGASELVLFNNGTIALMGALHSLSLPPGSEVVTTPFSFAASTHAITALGLNPVFADIEPNHMTLDPAAAEAAITPRTSCILAVHVYGFPARVEEFKNISERYGIPIVYDAAHAFNAKLRGEPIASFGAASVFSFHATKLFNTIEGGAVCINHPAGGERLRRYRNFGIRNEDRVDSTGVNGKMSEIHALFGLLNLESLSDELIKRQAVREAYFEELSGVPQIELPPEVHGLESSLQYFPIRVISARDDLHQRLKEHNVFTRKYFYPLIADFDAYADLPSAKGLPNARAAAREVLCLPFFGDLADGTAYKIARFIKSILAERPPEVTATNIGELTPAKIPNDLRA
jgi:dTDP-4-amino-4,6-dideoxygalactose transaminase